MIRKCDVTKTFRIRQDVVDKLSKLSDLHEISASNYIRQAILEKINNDPMLDKI